MIDSPDSTRGPAPVVTPTPTTAPSTTPPPMWVTGLLLASLAAVASPWSRPDIALVCGIALALLGVSAYAEETKSISKWLIQACVVILGLRLDLSMLAGSALAGLALAVGTIFGAIAVGMLLGRLLGTGREISTLITSGTAICGGSAIAAVGTAIGATASSMAVATGAIFLLNAVGLWTLPAIGHALGLSDVQFGQWAGVALHDIASVGGASKEYGPTAFDTANVVKLTRVIWITPMALLAGRFLHSGGAIGEKSPFPWFVVGFLAASGLRTLFPGIESQKAQLASISGIGFQIALFLIGLGLSRDALRKVGWRAIVQATLLWIILAGSSLAVIRSMPD